MQSVIRLAACLTFCTTIARADGYHVVVSESTVADPAWKAVADALVAKHKGKLVAYAGSVADALPTLQAAHPRHVAFVATPAEAGSAFVAEVHRLTRAIDDDPYTDCLWGIVTGYTASNALAIASTPGSLTIERAASGTDIELSLIPEGKWFCELTKGKRVVKEKGGEAATSEGPADSTFELVDSLNDYKPQMFVTSGHATERDWQIGFRYRNGSFRCKNGVLYGLDTAGQRKDVNSPNPKVYLPIGNCLMGHVDGSDAMALAWMNSAGVVQMAGYTVPTWYGYMGWGLLDYFVEQPGRYTYAEAFFANQQALIHRLVTEFPALVGEKPKPGSTSRKGGQDGAGLLHDRDTVAFYGDPAFEARMAAGPLRWEQTLVEDGAGYVLTITPKAGADTFKPVNINGSQRGGRPIFVLLPRRAAGGYKIVGSDAANVVATDDFVLVPNPGPQAKVAGMVLKIVPK